MLVYAKNLRRRSRASRCDCCEHPRHLPQAVAMPEEGKKTVAAISGARVSAKFDAAQAGGFGRIVNFGAALRLMLPGNMWLARKTGGGDAGQNRWLAS